MNSIALLMNNNNTAKRCTGTIDVIGNYNAIQFRRNINNCNRKLYNISVIDNRHLHNVYYYLYNCFSPSKF